MSGLKTSLAAFALLGVLSASAEAQGVVPGGWSAQFGYQPLGSTNFVAGPNFGFGSYPMGGVANGYGPSTFPSGMAVPQTGFGNSNFLGLSPGMPQTSIGADPLMGAISKSVRRSKRR